MPTRSRDRLQALGRSPRSRRALEAPDYGRRTSPYLILALTLLLGAGLGAAHNRWRAGGRPDPLLAGIRAALFPFQFALARTGSSLSTARSWFLAGKRLETENARLRSEVARLRMENQDLQAAAGEAARLRAGLGFAEKKRHRLLPAEVIGRDPSALFDTLILARGARDGVDGGTVGRTPDGLVGAGLRRLGAVVPGDAADRRQAPASGRGWCAKTRSRGSASCRAAGAAGRWS